MPQLRTLYHQFALRELETGCKIGLPSVPLNTLAGARRVSSFRQFGSLLASPHCRGSWAGL